MLNLLVEEDKDMPLVDTRKTTSDTTTRKILYACMKLIVLPSTQSPRSTESKDLPAFFWVCLPVPSCGHCSLSLCPVLCCAGVW